MQAVGHLRVRQEIPVNFVRLAGVVLWRFLTGPRIYTDRQRSVRTELTKALPPGSRRTTQHHARNETTSGLSFALAANSDFLPFISIPCFQAPSFAQNVPLQSWAMRGGDEARYRWMTAFYLPDPDWERRTKEQRRISGVSGRSRCDK